MAGVKVDLTKVAQAFAETSKLVESPALFSDIGEILLNNTRDRLTNGVDIYGSKFVPLTALTQSLKSKNKDKVLIGEGDLFRELTYQLVNGGKGLEFGSDRLYAAIQQLGGTIKPKQAKVLAFGGVFAKQVTLPARPFVGFTPQDETDVLNMVADHLAGVFD